jgi:Ca2+/H+ antiporter, TMEM165/GDT1 family
VLSLDAFLSSFTLVAISEVGDKTQLLAFSLASRFRRPGPILAGILVATLLNHGLAAWVGQEAASLISPGLMAWSLGITFIACGFWALIPDKLEEENPAPGHGAFLTTLFVFFLAEMGDKTQIATLALGAKHSDLIAVTTGTTLGMMFTNAFAVLAGDRLARKVQAQWIRWTAAALFFVFGIASLTQAISLSL